MGSRAGKEFGRRPYVSGRKGFKNNYVDEMRVRTEKGEADQLGALGYDVPQSEFKKPYQSPNYQGMEHYKTPENTPTTPTTPTTPPVTPPTTPNTGCGNAAGVTRFCREGDVVMIKLPWVSESDPIVGVKVIIGQTAINSGLTGGMAAIVGTQFISYRPGNAGQAVLVATTKSGKVCTAQVAAKPESECEPWYSYTYPEKLLIIVHDWLNKFRFESDNPAALLMVPNLRSTIDHLREGVAVAVIRYWWTRTPFELKTNVDHYPDLIASQGDRDAIKASIERTVVDGNVWDIDQGINAPSLYVSQIIESMVSLYTNNDEIIVVWFADDWYVAQQPDADGIAALVGSSIAFHGISYGQTSYGYSYGLKAMAEQMTAPSTGVLSIQPWAYNIVNYMHTLSIAEGIHI